MNQFRIGVLAIATLAAFRLATGTIGAQGVTAGRIQVDSPRPLSVAIDELRKRHDRLITYEEPLRVNPADAKDITETVPAERRNGRRFFGPKGGAFTFVYAPATDNSDASIERILTRLVDQFNQTSLDAQFRVSRTREIFHVIPASRKAANGVKEIVQPVLDGRITIQGGRRSGLEQLSAISEALRKAGLPSFGVGNVPFGALMQPLDGEVRDETARAALVRVLDSSPYKLDWALFCGASAQSSCALNIRTLPKQPER